VFPAFTKSPPMSDNDLSGVGLLSALWVVLMLLSLPQERLRGRRLESISNGHT
jgi:hypothetical protein